MSVIERPPATCTRQQLLAAYADALARTDELIDRSPSVPKKASDVRARAKQRLDRLSRLLRELADPLLEYSVVHIAGTSGKGSTAIAAAAVLTASGYRTGLHTSPYLQAATEKIQIDGALVDPTGFRDAVDRVLSTAQRSGLAPITYGEAWVAIAAVALAEAKVDIAVIEVGAGGRFDLTNVVAPAVSVITSVGLDHTETLGETISEIAWHKAGIIKPGVPVVTAVTDRDALDVIVHEAASTESTVIPVIAGRSFDIERRGNGRYDWWERSSPWERYTTAMPGRFQATNAATALAAIRALPELQLGIAPEAVRTGLETARLPGRFEYMQEQPAVVLDGAHNPEKMAALARDLEAWCSDHPGGAVIAVLGTLQSKDIRAMFAEISVVADTLIATTPQVLAKPVAPAESLALIAAEAGFGGSIHAIPEPELAVTMAIGLARPSDLVIVTGSLYLVGNIRGRWFPDVEVMLQRTSWPTLG